MEASAIEVAEAVRSGERRAVDVLDEALAALAGGKQGPGAVLHPDAGPGRVAVTIERDGTSLGLQVADDGVGLPAGFDLDSTTGLGLSIVRTLVTSELSGEITIRRGEGDDDRPGTAVVLRVPVPAENDIDLAEARSRSR